MAWIWPNLDDHSKTKAQAFCTYLTMSLYADPFWAYTLKVQFQNAYFHGGRKQRWPRDANPHQFFSIQSNVKSLYYYYLK